MREQVGEFRVVLAAGVARVAHADLEGRGKGCDSDVDSDSDVDRQATLDYVADHRERLSGAATALFEFLHDGETDVDPADLRTGVEANDEAQLQDVEVEVFGRFLDDLE